MKNTQISTKKRKSGIYSNKKKKTAIAVLILTVLCCLFSTITQATETHISLNRITNFEMYGYDSSITTQAWRTVTYTMTGTNSLETSYFVYGQSRQRIYLSFPSTITVNQFSVEYDITAENIMITGESNPAVRIPQTSSSWNYGTQTLTDETENNGIITRTYHIKVEKNGLDIRSGTMSIYTYFGLVSTKYTIKNFSCIINNEVYVLTGNIENEINNIEENAQQAHDAVTNDEYEYDDPMLAIRANNVSVNNALQYISEHIYSLDNIVLYQSIFQTSPTIYLVFMLSLTFALLSYVLFGKVI